MLGVAFSGGGIRSAAVCSGVLRRLLTKNAEPDYLSCVSGGGYTGSAYVDWKFRPHGQDENWQAEFFNHLRDNAGLFCNWHNRSSEGFRKIAIQCSTGCWDSVVLCSLLLIVFLLSISIWGSFAFPIAFLVKFLYGEFLDGTLCRKNGDSVDCLERSFLFGISAGTFVAFHLIDYFIKCCGCESRKTYRKIRAIKIFSKVGQIISGATFAFTFIPWFFEDFLRFTHVALQVVVVIATASFWLFIPLLRVYSSLVLLIYFYSYVVYWHLYERTFFGFSYGKERFMNILGISLCIIAVASILGDFQLRLVHIYNRWRLQRAFYYFNDDDHENCARCAGISCYDVFPGSHMCGKYLCACPPKSSEQNIPMQPIRDHASEHPRAFTLGDLENKKPVYISNVVVNGWRKNERNYCHIAMSPKGISVIDNQPQSTIVNIEEPNQQEGEPERPRRERFPQQCLQHENLGEELTPHDIKLSSAMAMSAAAVSPYLGKLEETQRQFSHALSIFGVEMAARIVYDMKMEREEKICCGQACCSYFLNGLIFVGILSLGVCLIVLNFSVPILPVKTTLIIVPVFIVILLLVMALIGCRPSGKCEVPECLRCCSRWMQVHIPAFNFARSILNVITFGDRPPAMLHLSDGGHFENYGILPLLRLRLRNILVVDGSLPPNDENYGNGIITAMEHARGTLGCSFTAMNGGDVLADIKEQYEKTEDGPRKYEFRVQYYDTERGVRREVDNGHIVLLAPRHPTKGQRSPDHGRSWADNDEEEIDGWGMGPYLEESDVNAVAGCTAGCGFCECCESCTSSCCRDCCKGSLSFPRHTTALQFFTPKLFTTYHREGYRAAMECEEFLDRVLEEREAQ